MSLHKYTRTTPPDMDILRGECLSKIGRAPDSVSFDTAATTDQLQIMFDPDLTGGEVTILDGIVAALPDAPEFGPSRLSKDRIATIIQQPQTVGYELCDRDFKIVTCKMAQVDAVEDLKIDTVTLKEVDWAGPELEIQGVYKDVAGTMTLCADQADADLNGILSVWNYKAVDQTDGTTQIPYNIRSGSLVMDPAIPAAERFSHRAYAIAVPDLGQSYFVRLFDGYVAGRPITGELEVESPTAKLLDPALAPGASNVIRIYVYHPQGQSNAHILWLMTYRPAGTF